MKKLRHIFIYIFLIVAAVAMAVFSVFFISPFIINNTFEKHASEGKYLEKDLKALEFIKDLQYPDGYITNYNLGNYYYHEKKYDKAATYYTTALSWAPLDKEKDCNIRINLVLSYLNQMDFEKIEASDDKTDAINQLHSLRDVLTENGCACEEKGQATGHSEDAEKLKKDIDDELEKLEDNQDQSEDQNQDQNQNNEDQQQEQQDQNDSSDNKLEKKLNQQKSDNNKDRREQQKELEKQNGDLNPSKQKQDQQNAGQGQQGQNGNGAGGSEQNQGGGSSNNNGSDDGGSSDGGSSGGDSEDGNQNYKVW